MNLTFLMTFCLIYLSSSCVVLHHVQIGEIDDRQNSIPIEVIASETGINVKELSGMVKKFSKNSHLSKNIGGLNDLIQLFQSGPKTGNPIFNDRVGERILRALIEKCPNGKITSISSIREMNKYLGVSGEIARVSARCLKH